MRLAFQILGEPVGKGRGRAVRTSAGIRVITPTATRNYEYTVAEVGAYHALAQKWPRAFDAPMAISIDAVFTRPADRLRKRDPDGRMPRERGRIDCDNVAKAILDGLQAGGIMRNDSQVCDLRVRLWWTARDESPCVEVECLTLVDTAGKTIRHVSHPDAMPAPVVSNPSLWWCHGSCERAGACQYVNQPNCGKPSSPPLGGERLTGDGGPAVETLYRASGRGRFR